MLNYDTLRYIFNYLNIYDLYNASLVCSTWWKAANDEMKMRGPVCIRSEKKDEIPEESWEMVKIRLNKSMYVQPSFIIYATYYSNEESSASCGCHCRTLQFPSYAISLNTFNTIIHENEILGMYFPAACSVNSSFFTFVSQSQGIYCEEINCLLSSFFSNSNELKSSFEQFFDDDTSATSCIILFCERICFSLVINLIRSLNSWFPNSKASIFGGLVDNISVCANWESKNLCRSSPCISSFVLKGETLQTWNTSWSIEVNNLAKLEEKLKVLKENVKLKRFSIGLMFISLMRGSYFGRIEPVIFKKYFPNMPLMAIRGEESFGGVNFAETMMKISINPCYESNATTTVMILTYD